MRFHNPVLDIWNTDTNSSEAWGQTPTPFTPTLHTSYLHQHSFDLSAKFVIQNHIEEKPCLVLLSMAPVFSFSLVWWRHVDGVGDDDASGYKSTAHRQPKHSLNCIGATQTSHRHHSSVHRHGKKRHSAYKKLEASADRIGQKVIHFGSGLLFHWTYFQSQPS